ncbi:MAG: hypothetical protein FWB77_02975 [Treponema sp.]|nr:hypothetical protein [Treponema sp.]
MRKSIISLLIMLSILVLTVASCKSTAETPAEPENTAPASSTTLNTAKANAEKARQQAMDFESNSYFPSEWEAVEAQFNSAQTAAEYEAAAKEYNELMKKAVPLYAQAREDEILAVREQLIATGFTEYFPQYLENADNMALAAHEQYEAGDYYKAKESAASALNEYETLLDGARVYLTRQEVIDRGFTQYDADNFLKADDVAQEAIDAFDAGDRVTAIAKMEEAQLRYNLVLSNGWTAYAADRKTAATEERELAIAERANIAARDTFRSGDTLYFEAEELFAAEKYSEAAIKFVDSEAVFAISRQETEEKRLRAEEAIRIAEEKIEESSESANEAERIIEGGSK